MATTQPQRFHLTSAWFPTAFLAGAGFLCGVATSAIFMLGIDSERIEKLQNELVRASAQIDALRAAQSSLGFALAVPAANLPSLSQVNATAPAVPVATPESTPVAQVVVTPPPATPAAPAVTAPSQPQAVAKPTIAAAKTTAKPAPASNAQKPPPADKPAKEKPTEAKPVAPATGRTTGMDLPLPESASAPTGDTKPPASISEGEVKSAIDKNSIEMAPKAKMGVDKIEAGAVVMASGAKVRVGDRFNSGEKLLSVDQESGRIVTDKRTVMITP